MLDQLKKLARVKVNEPLAKYTTFKIGGPAQYFCAVTQENLSALIQLAKDKQLPYFVLGGGSNLLISDQGYPGLVIKLDNQQLEVKNNILTAEAGAALSQAVLLAAKHSLSGLAWAMGIPGTLGGAVHNNAGAYRQEMADNILEVSLLSNGQIKTVDKDYCQFGYRTSRFKQPDNQEIILAVKLKLEPGQEAEIRREMLDLVKIRSQKFMKHPSAGSTFQNIILTTEIEQDLADKGIKLPVEYVKYRKIPAAWLIEESGLKGKQVGGAQVSPQHAGMIINLGQATAQDVIMLISIIKQKVRSKFNLQLWEEIEYFGF